MGRAGAAEEAVRADEKEVGEGAAVDIGDQKGAERAMLSEEKER